MDKVLVNLFIPAINEHFDVFIPRFLLVKEVCLLLGDAIQELSNGSYVSSGQELLCSIEKLQILRYERSLLEYGIQNGEHLLFC